MEIRGIAKKAHNLECLDIHQSDQVGNRRDYTNQTGKYEVEGLSWMDHEFSTVPYPMIRWAGIGLDFN